ncbi:MAG: M56 family metallopeptidase [Pseudomonadota bacterium]|nr:M56 family metallopeptidase [Pseudomonadota bacterium]
MESSLLALYLKLNVLLAAALLLWLATKVLARACGFACNPAHELKIARVLFAGLLGAAVIALCASSWLGTLATTLTDGVTVVAGIDGSLERDYVVGTVGFELRDALLMLLFTGFAWQTLRLWQQWRTLRGIVNGASEWRRLHGVHLRVSSAITAPFSTRALGKKHIVLPMALLESPRNLRLAIKHELQHVRNGDLEWVILLEAVKLACFWNPAAWLWHHEFDCLQEFACDEALIAQHHVKPHAYGRCLLEVASAHRSPALLAASNMVPWFSWLKDSRSQLKRRITMLTDVRGNKHQKIKTLACALLAGFGFAHATLIVLAADVASADTPAPIVRINPEYPQQALSANLEGWVHLEFTISETGAVVDPFVVDSGVCANGEGPESCRSDDMFKSVALAAIAKWRYSPTIVNGDPVSRPGIQTIIRFALENPEESVQKADL